MKRLLVTGAAGFIGRHIIAAARKKDWAVIAVDRRPVPSVPGVTAIEYEFSPTAPPLLLPDVPTAAILAAWPISAASYLTSPDNIGALHATTAAAQTLLQAGCQKLIGIGTCAEYDTAVHNGGLLDESHPTKAGSLYAACKISAQVVLEQLCHLHGAALSWARVFNPYGVGEPPGRLIPSVIQRVKTMGRFAAGSGAQVRDYVAVEDIAEALVILAESDAQGLFNICSGVPITLAEVMHIAARSVGGADSAIALGAKPDRPWDPPSLVGNPSRLSALGWQPRAPQHGLAAYTRYLGETL